MLFLRHLVSLRALVWAVLVLSLTCGLTFAQKSPAVTSPDPAKSAAAVEFSAAADEVLAQMSHITGLKLRTPVKKTLRSREEIRASVISEMNQAKAAAHTHASAR